MLVCPEGPGTGQAVSRGLAAGKGALLPGSTVIVPRPCSALNAAASPVLVWPLFCVGRSHLWGLEPSFLGSRTIYVACGWRDCPPNALSSPLCRLLQQMTRSQQMDELLDVLIESGGMLCFPPPFQGSPSRPALVCGAQGILCTPAELPESSAAFPCPPVPAATETEPKSIWALLDPAPVCATPTGCSGCHLCREKGQQGRSSVHSTASPLPTQSPRCAPHPQGCQGHPSHRALVVPSPVQSAARALPQPLGTAASACAL